MVTVIQKNQGDTKLEFLKYYTDTAWIFNLQVNGICHAGGGGGGGILVELAMPKTWPPGNKNTTKTKSPLSSTVSTRSNDPERLARRSRGRRSNQRDYVGAMRLARYLR